MSIDQWEACFPKEELNRFDDKRLSGIAVPRFHTAGLPRKLHSSAVKTFKPVMWLMTPSQEFYIA
uniref:Uncharacterized protein n=1 Tax=Arundo donax TaxID=35708 RepID=A0A0A9HXC2_ARUDO